MNGEPDSPWSRVRRASLAAHVAPLAAFLVVGALGGEGEARLWVYPVQAIVGLAVVGWFWPSYPWGTLRPGMIPWILGAAILGIACWVAPGGAFLRFGAPGWMETRLPLLDRTWAEVTGWVDRSQGFDPGAYAGTWLPVWTGWALRWLRLAVTVPLVEEICWRGFVMRLVANPDRPFEENPFGQHRWKSYFLVTALVTLAHRPEDWIAAWIFGSLVYGVAVRTKSLAACVLTHAVANVLLGIVIASTRQWGYW